MREDAQLEELLGGNLARLQSAQGFLPIEVGIYPSGDVQFQNMYSEVTEVFKETSNFSMTKCLYNFSMFPRRKLDFALKDFEGMCDNSCCRKQIS